jgi:hypothetical protein
MIKKYRKKPVVVEAIQYSSESTPVDIINFFKGNVGREVDNDGNFYIETLEGKMKVREGDYIIRGVKGEYYPCKEDIFKLTYEVLDE